MSSADWTILNEFKYRTPAWPGRFTIKYGIMVGPKRTEHNFRELYNVEFFHYAVYASLAKFLLYSFIVFIV